MASSSLGQLPLLPGYAAGLSFLAFLQFKCGHMVEFWPMALEPRRAGSFILTKQELLLFLLQHKKAQGGRILEVLKLPFGREGFYMSYKQMYIVKSQKF